jgi:hypothetical protein
MPPDAAPRPIINIELGDEMAIYAYPVAAHGVLAIGVAGSNDFADVQTAYLDRAQAVEFAEEILRWAARPELIPPKFGAMPLPEFKVQDF